MFSQVKNILSPSRLFMCANRLKLKHDFKLNIKFDINLQVHRPICFLNSVCYNRNSSIYYYKTLLQNDKILLQKNCGFGTEEILQDSVVFETVCDETLDSLCEFFDDLVEARTELRTADIVFNDGVLTVNLGAKYGTYVINRQSPNRQIWLSSPTSGPKRYDYIPSRDGWVYRHEPEFTLHELLQSEIEAITNSTISLSGCSHCGSLKH